MTGADPATVIGDPLLLKRLFANLINNAVAYGGETEVRLDTAAGWATVAIADRGPGLAPGETGTSR